MDSLKRLGIPFSILIVCALLQRLMDTYLRGSYTQTFHTIFLCAALFFFGYFLNAKYKIISYAVMPKVFSFCFESQCAELLAMRFCPFLLLCSRVVLKRREESFGKRPLEVP